MSLTDRFAESDREELLVDGRFLRQVWRCRTGAGTVRIERVSATDERPQGLVIESDTEMTVAGRIGRRFVLWADTAPDIVEVSLATPTELRLWNVWDDGGMTQAWLGAASIHAETTGERTRLACRDGHGDEEAAPTDLVVELVVEPA